MWLTLLAHGLGMGVGFEAPVIPSGCVHAVDELSHTVEVAKLLEHVVKSADMLLNTVEANSEMC